MRFKQLILIHTDHGETVGSQVVKSVLCHTYDSETLAEKETCVLWVLSWW